MTRRQEGFTLIEILVVITIIAALVGLVTLLIPKGSEERKKVECMNNLRQIGGLLAIKDSSGKSITTQEGAAFVLQVARGVKDDDLKVFICPGEKEAVGRPDIGSDDFKQMYRANEKNLGTLDEEALHKMCSFAGPSWQVKVGSRESRLWACDACQNRGLHHQGISCLWDSSKVTFIDIADLEGQDEDSIYVGPGSGDKRLATMIFYPKQK